ncbi:NucA/NucB deoxyribonuclease domain-containing protein [Corynebacterium sp. KPL4072]|uniref:NucA/NucB deoxyribonuclease domain-containing protein n=1 Tax=Corynebacterium sp. KPL4072 TaxID=3135440 RepID=UPI0040400873
MTTKGSPDEFPYTSTMQGGKGATVNGVSPLTQNKRSGRLRGFYRRNNNQNGGFFRVKLTE